MRSKSMIMVTLPEMPERHGNGRWLPCMLRYAGNRPWQPITTPGVAPPDTSRPHRGGADDEAP